jgi:hypothetical protein
MTTQWRATGSFIASSALFTGILDEIQLFLLTYAEQEGAIEERVESTKQLLIEGRLPQRSRSSRKSIVDRIARRLTTWNPPAWVLDDLVIFASQPTRLALQAALLMHVCRQDQLLYTLVHQVVAPRWDEGRPEIDSTDVQRFLDNQVPNHPEIETWTRQTRDRLGSTTLSILRDYGLLQGKSRKKIIEPIVPGDVVGHVERLLRAEGVAAPEISSHPDWRLWLWDEDRTRHILSELTTV